MMYAVLSPEFKSQAENISREIYALCSPAGDSVTQYYCGWTVHPDTGDVALAFPNVCNFPIARNVDTTALMSVISNGLSEEQASGVLSQISPGTKINPLSILPSSVVSQVLTRKEMRAAGWVPAPPNEDD